jgi:hypothetical protein
MAKRSLSTQIALGIVAGLLALPWAAFAQDQDDDSPNPDNQAAQHAGVEAWFREHIAPSMARTRWESPPERPPVLYDPNEVPPMPGRPAPDRRSYAHRATVGPVSATLMAGDLPPTRAEWNDTREWDEPIRPEMFRFYFEGAPPASTKPPICPVKQE